MTDTLELMAAGGRSVIGSRPSQQDKFTIHLPEHFPKSNERLALFGVYDGHASSEIAQHASWNIPRLIINSPHLPTGNYEEVIKDAIKQEDKLLSDELKGGEHNDFATSGSTISVCLVNMTTGVVVVGNLGDSHILIAEAMDDGGVRDVTCLTTAHKPEDPDEKERIEGAGGVVRTDLDTPRIGYLNMSRSLGDFEQKNPFNTVTCLPNSKLNGDIGNFLSNDASVSRTYLVNRRYFLALTTDGVTDALSHQQIMENIAHNRQIGMDADLIAEKVVVGATIPDVSDNSTCVAVFLDGVQS